MGTADQPLPPNAIVSPEVLVVTLGDLDVASLRQAVQAVEQLEDQLRGRLDDATTAGLSHNEILREVEAIEALLRRAAPGIQVSP